MQGSNKDKKDPTNESAQLYTEGHLLVVLAKLRLSRTASQSTARQESHAPHSSLVTEWTLEVRDWDVASLSSLS